MPLPILIVAPTLLMFVIGIIVCLREAGYSFDLRKRKLFVRNDRRLPR